MGTVRCTLDKAPGKYSGCNPETCLTCGFEAAEMARWRKYLQQHDLDGLTRGPDGLRRLVVNRAGDTEENAAPGTDTPEDG